ncbi:Bifunctional cytokinin biosynthesis protein [Erysiphe necator]|uniref:Putative lysine decarboxylase-like protein n=1 Tax=Uncinula necator TaxID=52586 RepID=A0A0B1PBD6_UNCNE|nr:Bifunctional cytokinin biosynthesis protein [Erysiphe necator]KHJ33969.1 putative lysine decarboxylase-like protein [Erysiphe necator]
MDEQRTSSIAPKNPKQVICVFCGSSQGKNSEFMESARELAHAFHQNNVSLIYGGGTCGLMGELAKVLTSLSGPDAVHGIIPAPFVRHENSDFETDISLLLPDKKIYGKTTVVKNMHERKQLMISEVLSGAPGSGFIALPGGYGTMEELMEMTTWNGLGIHDKGVVVFNIQGYWSNLLSWVENAVESGFISANTGAVIKEAKTADQCIQLLKTYKCEEGRLRLDWNDL